MQLISLLLTFNTSFLFLKFLMASSSHYHYHKDDDNEFDSIFDDLLENLDFIPEPKERKKLFLSRETGKKATTSSGMIILSKLQHTRTIYSGGGFE